MRASVRSGAPGLRPATFTWALASVEAWPLESTSVNTLETSPEESATSGVRRTTRRVEPGSESEPCPETTKSVRP